MKRHPQAPLVTSATSLLQQVTPNNGVKAATESETKARKQKFLKILDSVTDKFMENMANGLVEVTSTLDLERVVKMVLLVSGEADSIQGQVGSTTQQDEARISMSKIDAILDENDPAIQDMFKRIYDGYNALNDAENARKEGKRSEQGN